jgi:radical SAM superfamily enzyme YgiQ (UPF0313 family)
MARPPVLLVNPNRMRPPVAPIGLEYVAAGLRRGGYEPVLCDLTWPDDPLAALVAALDEVRPAAVGVSVRNLDDVSMASGDFVLETTAEVVRAARSQTRAPVVLGGIGFSFNPGPTLTFTGATHGVVGDAEESFARLLDRLLAGELPVGIPGAVYRDPAGTLVRVPRRSIDLALIPAPSRRFVDGPRYFAEGGQAGIETLRGCTRRCVYCCEPAACGATLRLRDPASLADEVEDLLDQGIDVLHLCDTETNLAPTHIEAWCAALTERGLAEHIRWYAYGRPLPLDAGLAETMARAGCAGLDLGADHGDPAMLRRLGHGFGPEHIVAAVRACRDAGIAVMLDMMLGGPGETRDTLATALELARRAEPDCVGLSVGVRLYPDAPLARAVRAQAPVSEHPALHGVTHDNEDLLRPVFYVSPALGASIHAVVAEQVAGDTRFFHADPAELDGNYNYNDHSALADAIRGGARGAYWDILRRPS